MGLVFHGAILYLPADRVTHQRNLLRQQRGIYRDLPTPKRESVPFLLMADARSRVINFAHGHRSSVGKGLSGRSPSPLERLMRTFAFALTFPPFCCRMADNRS